MDGAQVVLDGLVASSSRSPRGRCIPKICSPDWVGAVDRELTSDTPTTTIDAVVEADADARAARSAALVAHATQVVVGPTGRSCALSNNMAMPILGNEHYVLAVGRAGDRDERGWETDLLAGLMV